MLKIRKIGIYLLFTIMFALGFHIIMSSIEITFAEKMETENLETPKGLNDFIRDGVLATWIPNVTFTKQEKVLPYFLPDLMFEKYNLANFVLDNVDTETYSYEKIMVLEAMEEEEYWQDYTGDFSEIGQGAEEVSDTGNDVENEMDLQTGEENPESRQVSASVIGKVYSEEELKNYDLLLNQFYTVDKTTSIGQDELNGEVLSQMDLTIDKTVEGPLVLIYHTHSQETFSDSVEGDVNTSIVGVGVYLKKILEEDYGVPVYHLTSTFDIVDGKLDRNKAYSQAEKAVEKVLAENPSIQIVIDLHRDGVGNQTRLVTEVNGKPTAQIMFFNGLSRTNTIGDIGYLKNPYLKENLALSFQMKLEAEKYFPGFTRKIYLKGYRYNLHLSKGAMLIEAGAQTNTVQEVKNAMVPLGFLISKVLLE